MTTQNPNQIAYLYNQLKVKFDTSEYDEAYKIMQALKVLLIKSHVLFRFAGISQDLVLISRDTLEMNAYLALFQENIEEFKNCISQLHSYYFEPNTLPESPRMYPLLGLDLLRCLVQHQLIEFHTKVERLDVHILASNPYIRGPLVLEQCLMEGSFHKAAEACANVPGPEYKYFMSLMMTSLREELADCLEKACDVLPLSTAVNLLMSRSEQGLSDLIQARGWIVDTPNNLIYLSVSNVNSSEKIQQNCSLSLATSLSKDVLLARELERII